MGNCCRHYFGRYLIFFFREKPTEAKDVNYFKTILAETDEKLTQKCDLWESKMAEISKTLSDYEEICSNIRSTIGKANLLMNKKGRFEQFRGLIHNCEFNLGISNYALLF